MGNRRVLGIDKKDYTMEFFEGAKKTLMLAKANGIKIAILKSRSPSCGYEYIYDGTFSGKLIRGSGFTTEALIKNEIEVFTENDLEKLFNKNFY